MAHENSKKFSLVRNESALARPKPADYGLTVARQEADALKRPNPFPRVFGFHEIWHLFVLGGSALHYVAMLLLALG